MAVSPGSLWNKELPLCTMLPRIRCPTEYLESHLRSRAFRRLSHIGILDLQAEVNMSDPGLLTRGLDFYPFDLL